MKTKLPRRTFLSGTALSVAALGTMGAQPFARAQDGKSPAVVTSGKTVTARDYLKSILYTKDEVKQWLAGKAFPFAKYNSEFGWLLRNARFQDGMDGSTSVYTYGLLDERITIHYKDQPCRINTYGNSYTQCHQVSDGETWQEVLAAHLQEPVRNFGVGGWSVYQAYRRMLKEEQRAPAEYIVFNIYDDDHFRSLDSWRNIRVPKHERFIEPTLPHVVVNVKDGRFEERPNVCPNPESVYHLCDLDWVAEAFKDDFSLKIMLAHLNAKTKNPELAYAEALKLATTHGIVTRIDTAEGLSKTADQLHHQSAYFASQRIVEKIEAFAKAQNKKVLFVLSYPPKSVTRFVTEGVRADQPFVDFLKQRGSPVVDLMQAHMDDFALIKGDLKAYLAKYWVGHYNPRGNYFCAYALMHKLVEMLAPKPPAYRADPAIMK
ncbi:MAG: hypothetical protein IT579_01745 [Verrucomicrobia subdivision 3 bacterium]|nr:hypothetical protein [Verrucomicrobiota bacterium]MCC6819427.1 hypothetical protein [Limisphaerales bacterium]